MPRDPRAFRTVMAARPAATLPERFESAVEGFPIGAYRIQMTAEGKGGDAGPQQIRLVPPDKQAMRLLVGTANPTAGTAELFTLDHVNNMAREHSGEKTDIDPVEYAAFLVGATKCLEGQLLTVVQRGGAAPARSRKGLWIGLGILVVLIVCGVIGLVATRAR